MVSKREPPAVTPILPLQIRYKDRVVRLDCPDVYTGEWVDVWVNPPDHLLADARTNGDFLLRVARAWSFQTTEGQPAPLTAEALSTLPSALIVWLMDEWQAARQAPLVAHLSDGKRNGMLVTAP